MFVQEAPYMSCVSYLLKESPFQLEYPFEIANESWIVPAQWWKVCTTSRHSCFVNGHPRWPCVPPMLRNLSNLEWRFLILTSQIVTREHNTDVSWKLILCSGFFKNAVSWCSTWVKEATSVKSFWASSEAGFAVFVYSVRMLTTSIARERKLLIPVDMVKGSISVGLIICLPKSTMKGFVERERIKTRRRCRGGVTHADLAFLNLMWSGVQPCKLSCSYRNPHFYQHIRWEYA